MSISVLFFKRNIKKFFNIIFSLTFFILIFNFIMGFILNVTNNYKSNIVNNSNLYIMQIQNKDLNYKFNSNILDEISKIRGVEYAFLDYGMTVEILGNKDAKSSCAVIPVSKQYLKYFGIKNSINSDKYFFLNDKAIDSSKFIQNEQLTLCAHIPIIKDGAIYGDSEYKDFRLTSYFTMPELLYFPPDTSIIDPTSFEELFNTSKNNITSSTLLAICPKVEDMESVCKKIESINKNFVVSYALKTTNNLPKFAVTITTISSIILTVFLIITIFNVSSNIKQILILRKRDIGLLYILGIDVSVIYKLFINEFLFNGIVTLFLSLSGTTIISLLLNYFFKFDLISKYVFLYLILDIILVIILLLTLGYIQLRKIIKRLDSGNFYKEVLK